MKAAAYKKYNKSHSMKNLLQWWKAEKISTGWHAEIESGKYQIGPIKNNNLENKVEAEKNKSGETHWADLSVVSGQFMSNGAQPIPLKDSWTLYCSVLWYTTTWLNTIKLAL